MIKTEQGSYMSLQFFSFKGLSQKLRALADMGRRTVHETNNPPLFYRHLGSGAGQGFSLLPDWGSYAFLCIWNKIEDAQSHMEKKNFLSSWEEYADESLSMLLQCSKVHGQWAGQQVLTDEAEGDESNPVAVLTRAKIKFNKLARFWQYVPQSSRAIENANGCFFSKGVGEWPFSTLATFSIWKDMESMSAFAYQDPQHAEIIAKVRKEGWFAEEMFARFTIVSIKGSYQGFSENKLYDATT